MHISFFCFREGRLCTAWGRGVFCGNPGTKKGVRVSPISVEIMEAVCKRMGEDGDSLTDGRGFRSLEE